MTEDYKGQCEFCFKYFPDEKLTVKECGIWTKTCCEGCLDSDSGIEGISEDLTSPDVEAIKEDRKEAEFNYKPANQLNLF